MSSRLSSASASCALSDILEKSPNGPPNPINIYRDNNVDRERPSKNRSNTNKNGPLQIQTSPGQRKPAARLTMQSYFDKENKFQAAERLSSTKRRNHMNTQTKTSSKHLDQNILGPPAPSANASANRVVSNRNSLPASIKTTSTRSSTRSTPNNLSETSFVNIAAATTNSNSRKSCVSYNSADSYSHKSYRNYMNRLSIDTFNSTSSSIAEYEAEIITDGVSRTKLGGSGLDSVRKETISSLVYNSAEKLQVDSKVTPASNTAPKDPLASTSSMQSHSKTKLSQSSKKSDTINSSFSDKENSNLSGKRKSITKSSSFISIRNSLSMKSMSMSTANDNQSSYAQNPRPEKRSSLSSKRKMSLDNIRSFLSSNRYSIDSKGDYKNNISLPIMQPQTKDKIRNKLKHSSSVVSISSLHSTSDSVVGHSDFSVGHNISAENPSFVNNNTRKLTSCDFDRVHYLLLLKLCNQSKPVSFTTYLNKFQSSNTRKYLTKLNKSSNNYLFMEFTCKDSQCDVSSERSGVWKIIPIDLDGNSMTQALQELALTMTMSNKKGFITATSAKVAKGPCPTSLLEVSDFDSKLQDPNQLYLIMRLDYGGVSLKEFKLESWKDASRIFNQLLDTIYFAEVGGYEHRDLNSENILIKKRCPDENLECVGLQNILDDNSTVDVTIIDHALARGVVSGQVMYRNLYDADFFKGNGEYRHTIYKLMRRVVDNKCTHISTSASTASVSTLSSEASAATTMQAGNMKDWSKLYPIFNLLWVHYVLHILLFEKDLKPIKMNPILKKKGWLAHGGEVGEETAIYDKLMQGYRIVEPEILFGHKKNKYIRKVNNVGEFRSWYQEK